ncbi:MAG: corrinoid protein [Candidatus Hermodarchaeia archaeon]|jgi:5-methyltetrahydrofolate--homocysteine methyltransferase
MSEVIREIYNAVLEGNLELAVEKTHIAIDGGTNISTILQEGLIQAMQEVGELFESGEYYVPEMLIAARAMQGSMDLLTPHLVSAEIKPRGTLVIGAVQGDLHDIGKNLVAMMSKGAGFQIEDLGADVRPERFVEVVKETNASLVGLSALLTTTMPMMEKTIKAFEDAGIRDRVKIIIGGAPITQAYADEIGADGYAPDASRAANLAKSLIDG